MVVFMDTVEVKVLRSRGSGKSRYEMLDNNTLKALVMSSLGGNKLMYV